MTKQQFHALAAANGCSSHYQGSTRTMFVFGGGANIQALISKVSNCNTFESIIYQKTYLN